MEKLILWTLLIIPSALMAQGTEHGKQDLPVKWEELTSLDFLTAVGKSARTCVIPLGTIEKHGSYMPLGTDLIDVREIAIRAAKEEFTIIFRPFYFGQIYEVKQQPGTLAYSPQTVLTVLQETCDVIHRNGIEKIILVNGRGGNNSLLPYFCQMQLEKQKDYAVFLFRPEDSDEYQDKLNKMRQTDWDGHAGETETALMLAHRPDLVHLDRANGQSGKDQQRLNSLSFAYTAIWWCAQFPNHYAGDGSYGRVVMGNLIMENEADQMTIELHRQFSKDSKKPIETEQ
jgi:creatinine amidohydrolase